MSSLTVLNLAFIFSYLDDIDDISNAIKVSKTWRNAIIYTDLSDDFLSCLFQYNNAIPEANTIRSDVIQALGPCIFIERFCDMWNKCESNRCGMINFIAANHKLNNALPKSKLWNSALDCDIIYFEKLHMQSKHVGIQYLEHMLDNRYFIKNKSNRSLPIFRVISGIFETILEDDLLFDFFDNLFSKNKSNFAFSLFYVHVFYNNDFNSFLYSDRHMKKIVHYKKIIPTESDIYNLNADSFHYPKSGIILKKLRSLEFQTIMYQKKMRGTIPMRK